jgi:hypothetical protein
MTNTYNGLSQCIRQLPCRHVVRLIAVDGRAGAGKTTFATRLANALGHVPIIALDDFLAWDDLVDFWPRLEREVLGPLFAGDAARYRSRDWANDPLGRTLGDWKDLPFSDVVIVEGVGASRSALVDRLTCAVFVSASRELRLARGIARDGAGMRDLWLAWQDREDEFFVADGALERAALVVDGSVASVDAHEFVALRLRPPLA